MARTGLKNGRISDTVVSFGSPQVALPGMCRRTRCHNWCVTSRTVGELWDSRWP